MSTLYIALACFFGVILFLFFAWKKLKEDYGSESIFKAGLIIATSTIVISLATNFLASSLALPNIALIILNPSQLWFWGSVLGFSLGFVISIKKFHIKSTESMEAYGTGMVIWAALFFLAANVYIVPVFLLSSFLLYLFLSLHYKSFSWYKSGKAGFAGLTTLGIVFVARAVFALAHPGTFSFIGKIDSAISASIAFLFFFSVYNLAEGR